MSLIQASARALPLASESVQCVVTSPPYWGLRSYAGEQREVWGGDAEHAHEWGPAVVQNSTNHTTKARWNHTRNGRDEEQPIEKRVAWLRTEVEQGAFCHCGAWYGALGLEPTPVLYVQHIVEVFREVRRVLRKDGTVWLNLGDSYAGGGRGVHPTAETSGLEGGQTSQRASMIKRQMTTSRRRDDAEIPRSDVRVVGLKPKDLVGIPWRVAFALQADGWYLRSDIIWHKPNPMPESVTDRPTKSHEYLFLLTKSERYYYDADAIREPVAASSIARVSQNNGHPTFEAARSRREAGHIQGADTLRADQLVPEGGRNKRDVWTIPTHPYAEAHFATYPEALVEPCILAGSAAKACGVCGAPWARVVEREFVGDGSSRSNITGGDMPGAQGWEGTPRGTTPTCEHDDGSAASRILDPFNGSGTTGAVALRLGREYVGTDLSREYLAMAEIRIGEVTPIAQTVEHAVRVAGANGAQLTLGGGL